MSFESSTVAGIAVGAALGGILLATSLLLLLRRHEAFVAAEREAGMPTVVREMISKKSIAQRSWYKTFSEEDYNVGNGDLKELEKYYITPYMGTADGLNFSGYFCIDNKAPPRFDTVSAPYDISSAISCHFDNQLDLGVDHRIIERLLYSQRYTRRTKAIDFLVNRAALSFCNFGDNPKYALLPPKILELAEEISVRGYKCNSTPKAMRSLNLPGVAFDTFRDQDDTGNPFVMAFEKWRVATCKLYGRETMPPEVQISINRRIDFLVAVLGPILHPEKLVEARAGLQEKLEMSLRLALFCAGQMGLVVNSWDYVGPSFKSLYLGEPEVIPHFDMMAEKTLVISPAWLCVSSGLHGRPFINAYVWRSASLMKFTDEEWAQLTAD